MTFALRASQKLQWKSELVRGGREEWALKKKINKVLYLQVQRTSCLQSAMQPSYHPWDFIKTNETLCEIPWFPKKKNLFHLLFGWIWDSWDLHRFPPVCRRGRSSKYARLPRFCLQSLHLCSLSPEPSSTTETQTKGIWKTSPGNRLSGHIGAKRD